jgi:type VI secretion system protein VasG
MTTQAKAEDLRRLIGRLDPNALRHFQGATTVCASRTHFELVPEHLLLRLLDETSGDVARILDAFQVRRAELRRALQRILDELPSGHRAKPALSPKLIEVLQSADVLTDELGFQPIRSGLMLLAFAMNPGHTRLDEFTPELDRIDIDQLRDHFQEIVLGGTQEEGAQRGAGPAGAASGPDGALAQYTVDVTAKAEMGQIDPVFGRDKEIRQMIDIFSRRRKNNPILVGEPGTGKTAIVEGLALRIVSGDVPPVLRGVRLISLDLGLLQAGASVKGEFENRLKNVIKEIKASETPVITFIDEAHTLIGAGGSAGGSDAANLLKPALARGELRTVAATTWAEYKKYFEKDAALERRFQLVRCAEPSVDDAIVMIRGLKDKFEHHHRVVVLDEGVQAAVQLSNRYISGRFLPDKAVDLIDTAAARVGSSLNTRPGPLDDLDREISHLDVAVRALERDIAAGAILNGEQIVAEMRHTREELLARREELEQKWQKELEVVNRFRELRARLPAFADTRTGEGQPPAGGDGAAAREAEPLDEAALREKIQELIREMDELQGDHAMVHPHVDAGAVAAVVADWTGIPVGSMVKDEISAVLNMEGRLTERVVGQDHALHGIADKLRASRSGLGSPTQPMGVFLCVGPSGVGKTETALAVAELLFGGERFTVTINMSEYMEKHTVSQLKGSPPGYVGYGEGGVLTEAVRQRPYCVVLLDEVEKAHPDVLNLFYQVFDKGMLVDGEGRVVDFKNTVIFLTSNLGTDVIQGMCESGEEIRAEELRDAIYPQLREHFKPALLARMNVVPYLTIGPEIMKRIARIKVGKLADRLHKAHGMELTMADAAYDQIAAMCDQVDVGARNVDHVLDRAILPELSRRILEKMAEEDEASRVNIGVDGAGGFSYTLSD